MTRGDGFLLLLPACFARHCRLDRQSHTLRPSYKTQRRDADPDGRRKDRPQGLEAGKEGAAGGEYVI